MVVLGACFFAVPSAFAGSCNFGCTTASGSEGVNNFGSCTTGNQCVDICTRECTRRGAQCDRPIITCRHNGQDLEPGQTTVAPTPGAPAAGGTTRPRTPTAPTMEATPEEAAGTPPGATPGATPPAPAPAPAGAPAPAPTPSVPRDSGRLNTITDPLAGVTIPMAIGIAIRSMMGIAGALFLAFFVYGGAQYLLAMGEADKVKDATKTLVRAVVGLAIILFSYTILSTLLNLSETVSQRGATPIAPPSEAPATTPTTPTPPTGERGTAETPAANLTCTCVCVARGTPPCPASSQSQCEILQSLGRIANCESDCATQCRDTRRGRCVGTGMMGEVSDSRCTQ